MLSRLLFYFFGFVRGKRMRERRRRWWWNWMSVLFLAGVLVLAVKILDQI